MGTGNSYSSLQGLSQEIPGCADPPFHKEVIEPKHNWTDHPAEGTGPRLPVVQLN